MVEAGLFISWPEIDDCFAADSYAGGFCVVAKNKKTARTKSDRLTDKYRLCSTACDKPERRMVRVVNF